MIFNKTMRKFDGGVLQMTRRLGIVACIFLISTPAHSVRIKDLVEIQGARGNDLRGVGIVVGLAGTGDSLDAIRAQENMLRRLGVDVEGITQLGSDNVALVVVTATIPPFAKEGTRIDVIVSSIGDADSLEGGTLMSTYLEGEDGNVYAVAQGPVSTGGFNVQAGGSSVQKNHVTAGRVPMGAYVEREVPSTITDGERVMLLLKRPDFVTAHNIVEGVNGRLGAQSASAFGAGTVSVIIPSEYRSDLVGFIARLQEINVESDNPARVVINERTGTIVVGGEVEVKACHVAHGGLTIRVQAIPVVSQPPPFSPGETVETVETVVEAEEGAPPGEEQARLMPLQGVTAAEVAEGLNRLKVTPRDMIAIFQALRDAGVMDADIEIM